MLIRNFLWWLIVTYIICCTVSKISLRKVQNHYIWLPSCIQPPTEVFPFDDLHKILRGCQWMAKVPSIIERPKILTCWVGCRNITDGTRIYDNIQYSKWCSLKTMFFLFSTCYANCRRKLKTVVIICHLIIWSLVLFKHTGEVKKVFVIVAETSTKMTCWYWIHSTT